MMSAEVRVYLLYAGAMLFQLLYALCSYGEAYAWPGLDALARFGAQGIWASGTLATILLVYLCLAGQYESWIAPLAVILAVPLALSGPAISAPSCFSP